MYRAMERGVTVLLCASAVTIAASVVWREVGASRATAASPVGRPQPDYVNGWEDAFAAGIRVGGASARVTIVEFSDLECPACRRFQGIMREILHENPQDVALIFVHTPLPGHRFAIQAARVAECADRSGRFLAMIDAILDKQDSLGIKSWGAFAVDAGIADTAAIGSCARDARAVPRIDAGVALARKLEVRGTPTVLVNGWRYLGPTKEEMGRAIEAVRLGKAPGNAGVQ